MFFHVVIQVFAATWCTARVIDVRAKQIAWERSGKFEGDIMLTDEQVRNRLYENASRWTNKVVRFVIVDIFRYEGNFDKYDGSYITSFGVPYDYDSVMHYGPYAFSRNDQKTIESNNPNAPIRQKVGISEKGIEKLAKMYENTFMPYDRSSKT